MASADLTHRPREAWSVLIVSTLAFMVCFMVWMMFAVIGLFVGLAGGSFSVGTPCVACWLPRHRQGMTMGVYGAGNSGSAVTSLSHRRW